MTDDKPNIDAWEMTGYSTEFLRQAAQQLRGAISGIELPNGGRSDSDTLLMSAVEGLAIAADRIDRLHQDVDPVIVQIQLSTVPADNPDEGDYIYLFGLDSTGKLWQYMFASDDLTPGWLPVQSSRAIQRVPNNVRPIEKGKH